MVAHVTKVVKKTPVKKVTAKKIPPKKPPKKPATLREVAATGDRRMTLEALRDRLAADFEEAATGVVAQIAAQLRATLLELDELPRPAEVSVVENIATRRASRRSATS